MAPPYRLRPGDQAPVQRSATTCGSAALTVARMLVDPVFAGWVLSGEARGHGFLPELAGTDERVAAAEQLVLRRTTRVVGPGGRPQVPWPRALGTSPWGARHELEHGASALGTRYETTWCRLGRAEALRQQVRDLVERVRDGRPGLLYVGNATLPRHVTLVIPAGGSGGPAGTGGLAVYDPATGTVRFLDVEAFVGRRLQIAGWDVPWCTVRPTADRVDGA